MQVKPAPASCYRRPRVDGTDDPTALERLRRIERIDTLRREDDFTLRQALKAVELPRSTYYDWRKALRERGVAGLVPKSRRPFRSPGPRWTKRDERRVLAARDARPYCGKRRIHHELERRKGGCGIGASTVGRILRRARKRGRIRPCAFLRGRVAPKRRRDFANGHARRWKHGERATAPGRLVRRAACGTHRPHDRAPRRRRAQGGSGGLFESAPSAPSPGACSRASTPTRCKQRAASAFNARRFFRDLLAFMRVVSVQVDGGSEFMRHSWRSEVRGRVREARHRPGRAAAPKTPVERLRSRPA